jgi:phospholipase/lecithinase/hemolysin
MLDDLDGNPALKIRIHRLDAFSLFKDVIANPGEFGLSNVTDAALNLAVIGPPFAQPYPVVDDPENYLFWDYVHPTTVGHQIIGDAAFDALAKDATQVPEPPSVALVIIGIAVSIWQQRNQRRRVKRASRDWGCKWTESFRSKVGLRL